ncbi:hypothetical protein D3C80_1465440 [compost metagenome]
MGGLEHLLAHFKVAETTGNAVHASTRISRQFEQFLAHARILVERLDHGPDTPAQVSAHQAIVRAPSKLVEQLEERRASRLLQQCVPLAA